MLDGKAFGEEVVGIVKTYIDKMFADYGKRLDAIEKRVSDMPVAKEFDLTELRSGIDAEIAELKNILAALPEVPVLPDVAAMVAEAVAAIPAPEDGKSVTVDELRPMVEEVVASSVKALPKAKDGDPGKDGIGLAGAMIDRDGNLVVTLTNGETKELGKIVGKDGDPGAPGADGLGFEDMTEELSEDGRTVTRRYSRGEQVKEFKHRFGVVLDKGVFKEGAEYEQGDFVTWAGSGWIAQATTTEKPDTGKGWRLAIKRGRDGKDGVVKSDAQPKVKV